jgi:hypothetical protein
MTVTQNFTVEMYVRLSELRVNSAAGARSLRGLTSNALKGPQQSGLPLLSAAFSVTVIVATVAHYSFPNAIAFLGDFPTENAVRATAID